MRPVQPFLSLLGIAALAAQEPEPTAGLVAMHQARLDAATGGVVLNIAAHPDDEASRTNTVLRRKHQHQWCCCCRRCDADKGHTLTAPTPTDEW